MFGRCFPALSLPGRVQPGRLPRAGDPTGPASVHPVMAVQDFPQQDLVLPLNLVPLLPLVRPNKPAEAAQSPPSTSSSSTYPPQLKQDIIMTEIRHSHHSHL